MRLGSFKYNSPEFQCMRNNYAKSTFHCIFAIITEWVIQYIVLEEKLFCAKFSPICEIYFQKR